MKRIISFLMKLKINDAVDDIKENKEASTSSAQLRLAQISSALIEYLIEFSSASYVIRLVPQTQLSTD